MALDAKQPDGVSLYLAQAAMNDDWTGNRVQDRRKAQKALRLSSGREGKAVAAVVLAVAGNSAEACGWPAISQAFPGNIMVPINICSHDPCRCGAARRRAGQGFRRHSQGTCPGSAQ